MRRDPNDPRLRSWVETPAGGDFPIQNLPFGVFQPAGGVPRAGVAIGEEVIDLAALAALGYLAVADTPDQSVFSRPSLNALLALGRPYWRSLRGRISELLDSDNAELRDRPEHRERVLHRQSRVRMRLPVEIGDYVDFYSSLEHATNVGKMFRDPANPLLPNWKHLPVGYHGRCSTIFLSGQDVRRPCGQRKTADSIEYGPSGRMDFELETGFLIGRASEPGRAVTTAEAADYIFGMVLLNDWSARDIQQFEYVPLGPFLGKSFATSITPWVVTMEALEPFRVAGPLQDPPPLAYLRAEGAGNLDLNLEVWLGPAGEDARRICRTSFRHMYWSMAQQLAHLTSNGASVRVGDLCGSGTVSGPAADSWGSLLELSWNGARPLEFPGARRAFLEDGDSVIFRGWGERDGVRVGFGELRARLLPALA